MSWFNKGLLFGSLILAGCASVRDSTPTGGITLNGQPNATATIEIERKLPLTLKELARGQKNGLLHIATEIVSTSPYDQRLQYLVYWYDASGAEIALEGRSWQPLKLHGFERRSLNALAPNSHAVNYRITVREVLKEFD